LPSSELAPPPPPSHHTRYVHPPYLSLVLSSLCIRERASLCKLMEQDCGGGDVVQINATHDSKKGLGRFPYLLPSKDALVFFFHYYYLYHGGKYVLQNIFIS
jgi:hypothetical protein